MKKPCRTGHWSTRLRCAIGRIQVSGRFAAPEDPVLLLRSGRRRRLALVGLVAAADDVRLDVHVLHTLADDRHHLQKV